MPPVLKGLKLAVERSGAPTRQERIAPPTIRELTPELKADWLRFFDGVAFADNPAWGICYCSVFHRAADESGSAKENRAFASDNIECGRLQGFLAYVDGKPAGTIPVNGFRLYTAYSGERSRDGVLELRFPPGLAAYSFTFG